MQTGFQIQRELHLFRRFPGLEAHPENTRVLVFEDQAEMPGVKIDRIAQGTRHLNLVHGVRVLELNHQDAGRLGAGVTV